MLVLEKPMPISLAAQCVELVSQMRGPEAERVGKGAWGAGVLERAGFTREGVVRSLPVPDGSRVDKTLFSLLPGE